MAWLKGPTKAKWAIITNADDRKGRCQRFWDGSLRVMDNGVLELWHGATPRLGGGGTSAINYINNWERVEQLNVEETNEG